MKEKVVHLSTYYTYSDSVETACGLYVYTSCFIFQGNSTIHPKKVTCKNCKRTKAYKEKLAKIK